MLLAPSLRVFLRLGTLSLVTALVFLSNHRTSAGDVTKDQTSKKAARKQAKMAREAERAKAASAMPPRPVVAIVPLDRDALAAKIDQLITANLDEEGIKRAPRSDDGEFLRRLYLDLWGVVPPAEKARAFLDSKDSTKRARAIDNLLENKQFGKHLGEIWGNLLYTRSGDNRRLDPEPLFTWLEDSFNKNKPWDEVVYALLTAYGKQDTNPAVTYTLANGTNDKLTDSISKLFLGVQLQCAQCHNHPFTTWKQDDYWGLAAFFSKVHRDNLKMAARKELSPGVDEFTRPKGPPALPESAKVVPPRFFLGPQPKLEPEGPQRPALARWLISPENPYFARAQVNRLWAHFFGRGFINPIDDMLGSNETVHQEVITLLTEQLVAHRFDLKFLMAAICRTETYQQTSRPRGSADEEAHSLFAQMSIKVMSPEQLYDSLSAVFGEPNLAGRRRQLKIKGLGNDPRVLFVNFFHNEDASEPTEYQSGIPQALRLMNSDLFDGTRLLDDALKRKKPADIVEHLFLGTLSRRPTNAEMERFRPLVASSPLSRGADILWALVNSSEFVSNH